MAKHPNKVCRDKLICQLKIRVAKRHVLWMPFSATDAGSEDRPGGLFGHTMMPVPGMFWISEEPLDKVWVVF